MIYTEYGDAVYVILATYVGARYSAGDLFLDTLT